MTFNNKPNFYVTKKSFYGHTDFKTKKQIKLFFINQFVKKWSKNNTPNFV